ncbi:glycosyltransferase family 4 protein [Methylobacterium sp. SyP6R]|uniref:glycosyltransferase family 4 protein n=1 Tax=Methylobacterium sp. SyP6R TaxID=2718876 RepID=UPI001F32F299|nr:glycosyltransferase family 4 protein [Methylobacterium sp. SyP6R]MCF4129636.1 glycosyltransferase family 4 protein [Methylobacterium sp. SyP6R]
MAPPTLALTWQLSELHGWGLVGTHTCLHLLDEGRPPLLLCEPALASLRPRNRARIAPLVEDGRRIGAISAARGGRPLRLGGTVVLHALSNGMVWDEPSRLYRGERNIGVIAFEDTGLDAAAIERARGFDRIVVHSTYNRHLLRERGLTDVACIFQGVDPDELEPVAPRRAFGDRFVIFSGGKLEFRKGQDIVLAAFTRFHRRHPEALLVTAWLNPWPHTARGMAESRHAPVPVGVAEGRLDLEGWATANGASPGSVVDLGFLSRDRLAALFAECHAAVFPNRCEGATNLVAMEAMACGVPTVLSANTGHLDLIREGTCLPLLRQDPVPDPEGRRLGWGESSVEEAVAHLEALYRDRAAARDLGASGRAFVRAERLWSDFARAFTEAAD